ncbi:MAG: hypothetical protein LBB14_02625, partial [Puniceicoccales bacterium]|nr:hypothetical protein [Puniceicoccales bacterium]
DAVGGGGEPAAGDGTDWQDWQSSGSALAGWEQLSGVGSVGTAAGGLGSGARVVRKISLLISNGAADWHEPAKWTAFSPSSLGLSVAVTKAMARAAYPSPDWEL